MKFIKMCAVATFILSAPTFANSIVPVSKETQEMAASLRDKATEDDSAYEILRSLTTEVGARHPGTPGEKAGIEWGIKKLTDAPVVAKKKYGGEVSYNERPFMGYVPFDYTKTYGL